MGVLPLDASLPILETVGEEEQLELSVVLPCLNEEDAIGLCVRKALDVMHRHDIRGEVVVSDNGSTDRSVDIALVSGARVVHQPLRGYGNAYLKGFAEARGRYILMVDSDNTYDLDDIPRFLRLLLSGHDFVNGNRFKGGIARGAMTWSHRYIGNPILSGILNVFFHTGLGDAHCGMRAFTQDAYRRMQLQTPGMEFASEMVIHAAKAGLKIAELPTRYFPREGESKLNTMRDGWRHLRFLLVYSPTHLFLLPGLLLFALGLIGTTLLLPGPLFVFGRGWDVHVMILAALATLLGYQVINLGLYAKAFSRTQRFGGRDPVLELFHRLYTLERGLALGGAFLAAGAGFILWVYLLWARSDFGALNAIRPALLGMTLMATGVQTMFSSFLFSLLHFEREYLRGCRPPSE